MRLWLTGGTGFVGSNIVYAALNRGAEVMTTVHRFRPPPDAAYATDRVDMADAGAVTTSIAAFAPDVVVHCGILNDWDRIYAERKAAWDAYVSSTRIVADASAEVGASFVLVSTDWVFDGTQAGADEATPPNPVNLYGVLKMAAELVALDRGGAVARLSGVSGLHRARPAAPRRQDPGFGYLVVSIVEALLRRDTFTVWESPDINMRATPSSAAESAGIILDIGHRRLSGIFHCCGADAVTRMELALLACDVFDLDPALLRSGPPPSDALGGARFPYDTSITAPRTSRLLGRRPKPLRNLLEGIREEYERIAA